MPQRFGVDIAVVSCLLLAPALVSAQSIGGTVTDATGGVLPGATIEVRSPALIEQVRATVSDGAGQYQIIQLEPGTYTVTFTMPGFSTFVRDGIELIGEVSANVDGQLAVGNVAETITVSGASPIVDVQNVAQTQVMTREVMDTIPTGKTYSSMAVLVPGMTIGTTYGISQDVGGQSGQASMRLSIHGGAQTDQRMLMDGMAVNTWTQEDGSALWFADGTLEEMQIQHSAINAEVETGGVNFNLIPRSGGNTFSSRSFFNYSNEQMSNDNVNQGIIDDGIQLRELPDGTEIPAINSIKSVWSLNPSVGGPIVRDRFWFFGSYSRSVADAYVAFVDDVDANALTYTESNTQTIDDQNVHDLALRLTTQLTPRNKLQFYVDDNTVCHCHFLVGTAIGVSVMQSAAVYNTRDIQLYQLNWTSTVSSRLLIDAAFSSMVSDYPFLTQPNVDSTLPGVIDAGGITRAHRGIAAWYPPGRKNWLIFDNTYAARASVSYVTGSHAAKFGTSITRGNSDRIQDGYEFNSQIINYRGSPFSGGTNSPIRATFNTFPLNQTEPWEKNYIWTIGTYAQDQWTVDRMTLNLGLRWDYFRGGYPDGNIPEAPHAAARIFPGADPVGWNDLSPRLGFVYDLRGDGRTALKVTASRYVTGHGTTLVGNAVNPALLNYSDTRFWLDGADGHPGLGIPLGYGIFPGCIPTAADPTASSCIPADGLAQCDPTNPSPNGECLAGTSNTAFGTLANTRAFDPDWAKGWGQRAGNWEFSGGIQHELTNGLSLNVTGFRRVFVNYAADNNRFQIPGEYTEYCVTLPGDPGAALGALPGAGQQRCGYYDINPDAFGLIETERTSASNFGTRTNHWAGVDFTLNARMDNGLTLQGGLSTGRRSENLCDLNANLNNPAGSDTSSSLDCERQEPFLTQVKMIGSYTLPGDVQVSAVLQSIPGLEYQAQVIYTAAQTTLGRGFGSGDRTRTLNVIDRVSAYTDRLLQFDLRLTKNLNVGGGRLRAMVDLYNLFNDSTVLKFNNAFGSGTGGDWLRPQALIPGRMLKFGAQIDF